MRPLFALALAFALAAAFTPALRAAAALTDCRAACVEGRLSPKTSQKD